METMNDSTASSEDTELTSPKIKKARAAASVLLIPTPTRNSIAKVAARSDDPHFDHIYIDYCDIASGVELLRYKEIEELERSMSLSKTFSV